MIVLETGVDISDKAAIAQIFSSTFPLVKNQLEPLKIRFRIGINLSGANRAIILYTCSLSVVLRSQNSLSSVNFSRIG